MRQLFVIGLALALAACGTNADTKASLNTCLTQKAYSALNDGSLMTMDVKTLATHISTVCLKKLALDSAGLSEDTVTTATNILTALKAAKSE